MEYFKDIINILKNIFECILSSSGNLKNISDIIITILGGVFVISGYNYIKTLKEKKVSATYGFWHHLSVKLIMLKSRIEKNNNIINNLYSAEIRAAWQNRATPPQEEELKDFVKIVSEIINLIDSEDDQVPAYVGWTEDYLNLISFLDDILLFNIQDSSENFKFNDKNITIKIRNEYCKSVCCNINNIISGIKKSQKEVERKLYK